MNGDTKLHAWVTDAVSRAYLRAEYIDIRHEEARGYWKTTGWHSPWQDAAVAHGKAGEQLVVVAAWDRPDEETA